MTHYICDRCSKRLAETDVKEFDESYIDVFNNPKMIEALKSFNIKKAADALSKELGVPIESNTDPREPKIIKFHEVVDCYSPITGKWLNTPNVSSCYPLHVETPEEYLIYVAGGNLELQRKRVVPCFNDNYPNDPLVYR